MGKEHRVAARSADFNIDVGGNATVTVYNAVIEFLKWTRRYPSPQWVYRGHGDRSWKLKPRIGRLRMAYESGKEKDLFREFKHRAVQHTSSDRNDWEWLSIARHHGLPTRILDWTRNPLVAAFLHAAKKPRRTEKLSPLTLTRWS